MSTYAANTFRIGYIRGQTADWFWFVLLPFFSLAFAFVCEARLGFVALASVNLWITLPHHCGTWFRTYGLREDWVRFRSRLIVGPIAIVLAVVTGFYWAPLSMFLVSLLWDHQHTIMQQYGLARIYDFKAKSGGHNAATLDFQLNIILFLNLLITVPLWTEIWVQQLYAWKLPVGSDTVRTVHYCSYIVTICFMIYYIYRVAENVRQGQTINPMKYAFLLSSYSLWYIAGWHTNSLLVFAIAHRLMHGLQYLVFVYWFLERKHVSTGTKPWMMPTFNWLSFAAIGLLYAVFIQLLLLRPFGEFAFGILSPTLTQGELIPYTEASSASYQLYSATILNTTALVHYYFDSFIWKIRDEKTQQGL